MPRSRISREIIRRGIPLIVSCDTNPPPRMTEKIASAFSSRLVVPEETLKLSEKTKLTKRFSEEKLFRNMHERDALASAIFAYKKIRPLIRKIDSSLKSRNIPEEKRTVVYTKVLLGKESIDRAIRAAEQCI